MTRSALITIAVTWTVVIFFMLRFLIKVIRTPQEKDKTPPGQ